MRQRHISATGVGFLSHWERRTRSANEGKGVPLGEEDRSSPDQPVTTYRGRAGICIARDSRAVPFPPSLSHWERRIWQLPDL
jgi:hypothetical protein